MAGRTTPTVNIEPNLDLVLMHCWYDMIDSGEKTEEYRAFTPYWIGRLVQYLNKLGERRKPDGILSSLIARRPKRFKTTLKEGHLTIRDYRTVTFHRGYTSVTMTFRIEEIVFGAGNPEWGAPSEDCFIIKLGERIS